MARTDSKWMPLYIGEYLADTSHLTRAQHGSYLLLLMAYWRRGGPLPDNDTMLSQIAKCTPREWQNDKPILAELFKVGGGIWTQTKADKELAKAAANTKAKAEAGAKGAAKRWQTDGTAIDQPLANASQIDAPLPLPSPSPDGDSEAKASVRKSKPRRTRLANDWQPSPEDHACAVSEGLTADEIARDLAEWREYWHSGEPRDPLKTDWSRTYRKHVQQFAPGIIGRRPRENQPRRYGQSPQSFVATAAELLSELEADARLRGDGGGGMEAETDDAGSFGDDSFGGGFGPVIDGTCEPQRDYGSADEAAPANKNAA